MGEFTCGVYETTTNTTTSLSTTVRDQSSRHMIQSAPLSDLIHQRWGHAFIQRLIDAQKKGLVQGFHTTIGAIHFCEACAKAKIHRNPSSRTPGIQPNEPVMLRRFAKVMCDISGFIETEGIQRKHYFLVFIDYATRYMWILFLTNVTTEDLIVAFDKFHSRVLGAQERLGELDIMKTFKTDCAAAFTNENFTTHVQRKGIKIEHSTPYTHHQNGIAERAIRTIREMGVSLILHSKAPKHLWPYAMRHAVYLNNRLSTNILGKETTPFIEMFHFVPDEKHLKV